MPPEDLASPSAWLLAMLRSHLAGPAQPALPALPAAPAGLAEVAAAEGLAGLAAEYLDPEAPAGRQLRRRRQVQFAAAARLRGVQQALGRALAAAGCQAMMLKGAALLEGPYAGAAGRRPLSDLDLLVRPAQAATLAKVLESLGLRRLDPSRWRGDAIEIDLHFDLLGMEGQGLAELSPFRVDEEGLWRRSRPALRGGPALRVPAKEDAILHLAIHGQKHAFCRLIWLLDLALLVPAADAAELLERAHQWRAERALAAALTLLEDLFGQAIPPQLADLPTQLGRCEKAWLRAIKRRHPQQPIGLGRLIAGFALPGFRRRLRYWLAVAWPGGRALGRKYPRQSRFAAWREHLRGSLAPRFRQAIGLLADWG